MNNKIYDIMKWVAIIVLPAASTFVASVFPLWDLPYADAIAQTITAVGAFLGAVLILITKTGTMQGTKTGTNNYPIIKPRNRDKFRYISKFRPKKRTRPGIILLLVLSLILYTFLYTISDYKNMPYFVYKFIYVITLRERRNEIMLLDANKQKFVADIAKYAKKYASSYGISVHSPIIAQAILESGWGKSKLATDYHNYFGMKCGTKWTGPSVNMTTQEEYTAGTLTTIKDNFRVYDSMEDGIKGYFEFIQLPRYENLKGITDPQKYIETIRNDGYATSSTYVDSLVRIIKLYNLTSYDNAENAGNGGNEMGSRQAMVAKMQSWIGKNEADGSFREVIDIYNSHTPRARGYKLQYSDEWCAGTVSAAAIATGNTDAVPLEVSCHYMIEGAKAKGIWVENDGYVPQGGDSLRLAGFRRWRQYRKSRSCRCCRIHIRRCHSCYRRQ